MRTTGHDINYETILGLKSGSEDAFDTVYKQYYGGLCAFASQYVPQAECEEIVQDVMMWLWENRETVVGEMSLKSLLFTIVKNKCLNSVSHRKVKHQVHEELFRKFEEQFEDPDFYIPGELMQKLDQAIKNLPEDYRRSFEMNRFDDMTYNDIAAELGVSPKTIAYRISQSLKILRTELKEYLPLLQWLLYL